MSILFTFPGQGAQRAGMLRTLAPGPSAHDAIAEASDVLGRDVFALDTAEALRAPVAVQLALLIAGVATARQLIEEAGAPDIVAGLSIGAYAAAVVASVLGYADALRLVEQRARLMHEAWPRGHGMLAILGLTPARLAPLIAQVHAPDTPVYLANFNAPTQLVIAGADDAMARVAALAQRHGAQGVRPVAIDVPSHCPLLDAPAQALAEAFAGVTLAPPRVRYLSASFARELRESARIADDLAFNMARPVRWHETTLLADELGARLAIEMPPGKVLTRLAEVALPEALCVAAADDRIDTLGVLMARERQRLS